MRLESLSIRRFRGIVEQDFQLNGKSTLIVGENGSGKSSVVDAIDFLLTGEVGRLTGQGTGEINRSKHIVNAAGLSSGAKVSGRCRLFDGSFVDISRSLEKPDNLLVVPITATASLAF